MKLLSVLVMAVWLSVVLSGAAMAGPVFAVVGAIAGAIGGAFAAISATAVGSFLLKTVASIALSALATSLQRKKVSPTGGISTETTTGGGATPQKIIFGNYATGGGSICPPMSFDDDGSNDLKFITYVIGLADYPITSVNSVIIDGNEYQITNTVEKYGNKLSGKMNGHAWIRFRNGTQAEADDFLTSYFANHPQRPWSVNHKLIGVPYAVVTFAYDREKFTGLPEMRFSVSGAALYDPRKDTSVGGSGSHRWDNPSTWEISHSPIVQAYNIIRGIRLADGNTYGIGATADSLPLDRWFAAMNTCDEPGTQPLTENSKWYDDTVRYRSGFEFSLDDEPLDVIEELLAACGGQMAETGGYYTITVGPPDYPVAAITDENIIISEQRDFEAFAGLNETYNAVHASYPSPEHLWETKDAIPLYNAAWENEDDGRRLIADLKLGAVPYPKQVRRLMLELAKDNRRQRKHTIVLGPWSLRINVLDVITWTSANNGYAGKSFEVLSKSIDAQTLNVTFNIRERDNADYSYDADFVALVPPVVDTAPVKPIIAGIVGFSAYPVVIANDAGKAKKAGIRIEWDNASAYQSMSYEIKNSNGQVAENGSIVDIAAGYIIVAGGILPSTEYSVRVKAKLFGRNADWSSSLTVTTTSIYLDFDDFEEDFETAITNTLLAEQTAQAAADAAASAANSSQIASGMANDAAVAAAVSRDAANAAVQVALGYRDQANSHAASANASAIAANTAKGLAETARNAANTHANNANTAKTAAETARNLANNYMNSANSFAIAANAASTAAGLARDAAQVSANNAANSASASAGSASVAATHANSAANSASAASAWVIQAQTAANNANTSAGAAATSASAAATSANNSAQSATASANSAVQANTARGQAQTFANNAATSASAASGSAATATTQAGLSANSATNAGNFATAASNSASVAVTAANNAGTFATAANTAKTAAETAKGLAESARDEAVTASESANGSATTATTQAGLAATARIQAANSATQANTSAGEAAASATASANSAGLAAASANSAGTFATAANTARTAAETARGQANTFALQAANSATLANTSAAAASTSAGAAANSANQAGNSASAAAGSASSAQTFANNSSQSATASANSAVQANTSAGEAATWASQAANSASSAAGSSVAANTAAGLSVSARDAANQAAMSTYPTNFNQDATFFGGDGGSAIPQRISFINDGGLRVAQTANTAGTGHSIISWRRSIPYAPTRKYRFWVVAKTITEDATVRITMRLSRTSGADGGSRLGFVETNKVLTNDYARYEHEFTPTTFADSLWCKPELIFNYSPSVAGAIVNVVGFGLDDITNEVASRDAANAALVSSQAAAASANSSMASANAAQQFMISANTARSDALIYRNESLSARDSANASAVDANSTYNLTITARDAAQNAASNAASSASASAGSASTAAGHANSAGSSATASQASAVAANTARGHAQTFASQAASSADAANASSVSATSASGTAVTARNAAQNAASAAATSETNAAASANSSAQSAVAANTARVQAETARGQANTFMIQAANSANQANGSASAAALASGVAASARDVSVISAMASNHPSRFTAGLDYFVSGRTGSPETNTERGGMQYVSNDAEFGQSLSWTFGTSAGANVLTRGVFPWGNGLAYRVDIRFRVLSSGHADNRVQLTLQGVTLNSAYDNAALLGASTAFFPADGTVQTITGIFSDVMRGPVGGTGTASGKPWVRLGIRNNRTGQAGEIRIDSMVVTEVSGSIDSAISATASTDAASIATTAAGAANSAANSAGAAAAMALDYRNTTARMASGDNGFNPIFNDWTSTWPARIASAMGTGNSIEKVTGPSAKYINALRLNGVGTQEGPVIAINTSTGDSMGNHSPLGVIIRVEISIISRSNATLGNGFVMARWIDNGVNRNQFIYLKDCLQNVLDEVQYLELYFERPASWVGGGTQNFSCRFSASNADTNTASFLIHRFSYQDVVSNSTTSIYQKAVADLSGIQSAVVGMRAVSGNTAAGLELVALSDPDGAASTARINANNIILNGSVRANHLAANSVNAQHINVTNLSSISAVIGILRTATSGQRTELHSDKYLVYDASNVVRVKIGNLS